MTLPSPLRRLLVVAVAALAAGVWPPGAPADDAATFDAAFEAAVEARAAAVEAEFEWRDTKKLLRQSLKLAEKGEYGKAIRLANRARRQGELALQQAREQETAWREMVLK